MLTTTHIGHIPQNYVLQEALRSEFESGVQAVSLLLFNSCTLVRSGSRSEGYRVVHRRVQSSGLGSLNPEPFMSY